MSAGAEHLGGEQQAHAMVARTSTQATMPLERATYHGILPIGQLPPVLVCDSDVVDCVVDDDVLALDDVSDVSAVGEVTVVAVVAAAVVDDVVPLFVPVLVVAAAAVVVDALCPSRHARAPPMESIVATLSAVAALRAPVAR